VSESSLSAYVQRCRTTMAEYERLRFLGVSHETARKLSGFESAVMGREPDPVESAKDIRKMIAGDV